MKLINFTALTLGILLSITSCNAKNEDEIIHHNKKPNEVEDERWTAPREYIGTIVEIDKMKLTGDMGVGWNTTNTLETTSRDKTLWGNPELTEGLIDAVAKKGFKTLRIPVTWGYNMGDAPDFKIEKKYLERVEEVVVWALENNMYVIINIHHDDHWLVPSKEKLEAASDQIGKVWMQIAEYFNKYNEKLIFETINEPREKGHPKEWSGGDMEGRECINKLHAVALRAIRRSGGNNEKRLVMLAPWGASYAAIDGFTLPKDDDNILVSLHNYGPYNFALRPQEDEKYIDYDWGTKEDKLEMNRELDSYYNKFVAKGIPVIVGEWGAMRRDLPTGGNNEDDCIKHASHFATQCRERGIVPVVWDFGYIDRHTFKWKRDEVVSKIVEAGNIRKRQLK